VIVDLRLAIPAAAAWVAAAVVIADPEPAAALALWATAGLLVACSTRWPRIAIAVVAVAAAALVATSAALLAPARSPAALESAAAEGRVLTLSAVVTGSDPLALAVDGVPVIAFGPHEALAIGTTVQVRGELGTADPGDRVAYLLYLEGAPEVTSPPIALLEATEQLRAGFRQATAGLPGRGGDLLTGLAIGDTASVDDSLDAAMKASSLSHLTAVSGANCAIVVGLVIGLGVLLRMPRPARIMLALTALAGFVLLVTPEPSVLRASVMAAIVLAALASGRPVRGIPVLALAVIVLLTIDPWLAREYGFVLSVLATGGLLLLAGPIAARLQRWLRRWLALVIAVPVAAQLACQPVLVLLDASLPTYGVIANVLAAPAAPIATIVGLAACLVLPIVPPLGLLLCQLAWLPSAWIAAVAGVFAAAPGARLPWPEGLLGMMLLVALTACIVLAILLRHRWPRAVLASALVCWLGIAAGGALIEWLGRPSDWQVAQCDVGQGDAVVLRSAGAVALVDTGAEPDLIRECLADLGIGRLDLLVLTHYDLDHVGGATALVGRVDRVVVGPSGESDDDELRAAFLGGGAQVDQVSREQTGLLGELRWRVLWPPTRLAGIEPGNPASVVLEVRGVGACERGCLSLLMLGDLGRSGQDRLLSTVVLQPVDIVKVSHHGSADQSAELYTRARATLGLIGVGADNSYGHPTDELLAILADVGTTPARSDELGLVLVSPGTTPGTVRVWSQR
jgi:competence protein ComEC